MDSNQDITWKIKRQDIALKIKQLLQPLCADISDYQFHSIKELVDHFEALGKAEKPHFRLSYKEGIEVDGLNNARDHIRLDILKDGHHYASREKEAKNDFERGVLEAISLIEFRVHCVCDI